MSIPSNYGRFPYRNMYDESKVKGRQTILSSPV